MTEYGVYFAKLGTNERHHIRKGTHPDDLPRVFREARWILQGMTERRGIIWQLHGRWSTGVEIWEIHGGDHAQFTGPDRRLAHARWGDTDLTCNTDAVADSVHRARASGVRVSAAPRQFATAEELTSWLQGE